MVSLGALMAIAPGGQVARAGPPVLLAMPVNGIPQPCPTSAEWPETASLRTIRAQLQQRIGVPLQGAGWTDPRHREMVKVVWETTGALSCTDYLAKIKRQNPTLVLNAAPISGWAWGDFGLTRANALTLDFAKWQQAVDDHDEGRMVRVLVHELGHAWTSDRGSNPAPWRTFNALYAKHGNFSNYGDGASENFSEAIGYYVARCASGNPYDSGTFNEYYEFARNNVFGGVDFGPKPGVKPACPDPQLVADLAKARERRLEQARALAQQPVPQQRLAEPSKRFRPIFDPPTIDDGALAPKP